MKYVTAFLLVAALLVTGCEPTPRGLVLPEGDAEHGKQLFVNFRCTACHSVRGVDLPSSDVEEVRQIPLGGNRVMNYAELVTAIINPSHRITRFYKSDPDQEGEGSPMTVYNDVMTVTELVDLVAFLEPEYDIKNTPRYRYISYQYTKD